MHDDRIGRLVLCLDARQRAALQALFGVSDGVLVGDLGERQPLHADAEPRLVHHGEHGMQAAIGFAHQPAGRAVVIHHAGRVAVNAHLLFERAAHDFVALAERAVGLRQNLRHDEERNALGALGRAFDARQHEMDDVLGEIMLARGDENLGAGDLVAAVALRRRLGAQQAEIGAAMRLGEIHRAGPCAGDHLGQIDFLLLGRAVREQRRDRALRQPRIHGERHVGRAQEFVDRFGERHRQALPAELGRRRDAHPAAVDELLVGLFKSLRRDHAAVVAPLAAFLVAAAVQGSEHFLAIFRGFAENGLDDVGRGVGKSGQIGIAVDVEHVVHQKQNVVDGCLVARHDVPPPCSGSVELRTLRFRSR